MLPSNLIPLRDDLIGLEDKYNFKSLWNNAEAAFQLSVARFPWYYSEIFLNEFPGNCAWLVLFQVSDPETFLDWLEIVRKVAVAGDYSGILFSLNASQKECVEDSLEEFQLVRQFNGHSDNEVFLYFIPIREII
jgi:hypothetical protein